MASVADDSDGLHLDVVAAAHDDAGDDDRLFTALYPGLRRFAGAVRPAHVEPDDLVQEAVARALRRGPISGLDDPAAYLRQTIVRLASNERRSWRRGARAIGRLRSSGEASDPMPSDLAELQRLPPLDRAVLFLTAVEGLPIAEVAALVGCSEQATRARVSRARRRLRAELEDDDAV
jgi:RNA polymerase sigma factor (sigma-70 family)